MLSTFVPVCRQGFNGDRAISLIHEQGILHSLFAQISVQMSPN